MLDCQAVRPIVPRVFLPIVALVLCGSAHQAPLRWSAVLGQPRAWYATAEARAVAEAVLLYQRASGGWPKDLDMTKPPAAASSKLGDATIDNGATTTQIRLLALVAEQVAPRDAARYRAAIGRGLEYLVRAQYPNGGWPQIYPVRTDYSRYITFNDNAMTNVIDLLEEVSGGTAPFSFVDADRRRRASTAVERGVTVVLKTQVRVEGVLTAWCAQYDEVTLEPRPARSFEPAALTASESVGIVRTLMRREPDPDIVLSVDAAVEWFKRVRLADGRWARFYESKTNRPIFAGRDGIVRYTVDEIERERREGYAWFGTWPGRLVERDYPAWKTRVNGRDAAR